MLSDLISNNPFPNSYPLTTSFSPPLRLTPPLDHRGYTSTKVTENVECEIMGVVLEEAVESYPASPPQVMQSDSLEDMESNVGRVVAWLRENSSTEGGPKEAKQ